MATTQWTGGNGNWTDPTWTDGVPDSTIDAIIDGTAANPVTVTFNSPSGAALSLDTQFATLAVTSGTLSLGSASTLDALTQSGGLLDFAAGGTINGPISQTGGTLENAAGTLALEGNATLDGTIAGSGEIATDGATTISGLTIGSGLTYVDAPNAGPGTVTQTGLLTIGTPGGKSAAVVNESNWTLSSTAADITAASAGSTFTNAAPGTLDDVAPGTVTVSGVDFINDAGLVENDSAGGTLLFVGGTFTNETFPEASVVVFAERGDIVFGPGEINTNLVAGTLSVGNWLAYGGNTLAVTGGPIVTDAALIALQSPDSELEGGNGTTFTPIQQSLATIAANGTLFLENEVSYSTTVAVTDAGVLEVTNAATFRDSAPLEVTSTGTLTGFVGATVAAPVTNFGTIVAEGDTLDLTGSLINHGLLTVSFQSALDISGPHNVIAGRVTGFGTLLFSGGSTTIAADASGSIPTVGLSAGATLLLERSVPALKNFDDIATGGASTLDLDGHDVAVRNSTFGGGALIDGGGTFTAVGTMALGGLALDGGTTLVNRGTASQTGSLTLGDASGGTASIVNNAGATYDIANAVSLSAASATADTITNAGLFEMTGSGTAVIGAAFTNSGTIDVTSGTLEITAAFTNTGTIIGTEVQNNGTTFITAPVALFNQYAAAMDSPGASAPLIAPPPPAPIVPTLAAAHAA